VQRAARKTHILTRGIGFVRTRPKFGCKTDYEENMDNSMPHSATAARMLHTQIRQQCGYFAIQDNVKPPLIFHRDAYLTGIIVKQYISKFYSTPYRNKERRKIWSWNRTNLRQILSKCMLQYNL